MEQTVKSKKFINAVEKLLDSGEVKNKLEIVKTLDWDNTALSNVLAGRRNVPADVYRKFTSIYSQQINNQENNTDTISKEGDVGKELERLIQLSIQHEAKLDVFQLLIESILGDMKGKSIAIISAEIQEAIKRRADILFDEYSKKR